MGIRKGLTVDQIAIFRAICRRGHLYDSPGLLGLNIFEVDESSYAKILLESNTKSGLGFIKSIFDFIDENGDVPSIKDAPDFHKDFLKEVRNKFSSFDELEKIIQEFMHKKKA